MNKLKYLAVAMAMLAFGTAQAALPTEATAAMNEIKGNISEMGALIWAGVLVSVALFSAIRVFKKGAAHVV